MLRLFEKDVCKMRCRFLVFLLFAGLFCLPGRADTIANVVINYVVNGTLYGSVPLNINENDGDPLSLGIYVAWTNNLPTGVKETGFPTSVELYGTEDLAGDFAISQPYREINNIPNPQGYPGFEDILNFTTTGFDDGCCDAWQFTLHLKETVYYGGTDTEVGSVTWNPTISLMDTPEPSSIWLLGLGAAALAAYGWRRRATCA